MKAENGFPWEEQLGANLIKRALEEPVRQISQNAGFEGSVVVQRVREGEGNFGFNAETGTYEDLMMTGIVDPTKVMRFALQNAASEVGGDLFMTIKLMVYGIVKAGSDVGADVAKTSVAATEGAIKAAAKAGTDISKATKEAVTGAIEAGDEIGTHASKAVRDALTTSIKGAKDFIKPPTK
jgi:hypothetical protein